MRHSPGENVSRDYEVRIRQGDVAVCRTPFRAKAESVPDGLADTPRCRRFLMIDSAVPSNDALGQLAAVGAPTLILAGPALALARQWATELSVLRRRSPTSDAVMTLSNCLRELADAIRDGRDTRLHLTIADVHATSGIPVSTLRWLCKQKPDLVGAQKHEGVWYINRAKFERYISASDREVPVTNTADDRLEGAVEAA